mgnify:CR=1 FL=1
MPVDDADVIIIGGGVIGSSIAWHLARLQVDVLVVEREGPAAGSSGACDGLVLLQSKKPGLHTTLAFESIQSLDRLSAELPVEIEFRRRGGLVVIGNETELEAMSHFVEDRCRAGMDVSMLDSAEVRELEPCIYQDILGATFCPFEGQINPIALNHSFTLGASQLGARFIRGETVREIRFSGGAVSGVVTDKGSYGGGVVVNAAGVFAAEIGRMAGLDIPIVPRRGQLLVTRSMPPVLEHCLISAGYIAAKFNPAAAQAGGGGGVSIEQTGHGNFLLGSTREFAGFDRSTAPAACKGILDRCSAIIPRLRESSIIRTFAGLRPYTPDGLPILGFVHSVPGLVMAAGHEGDGITLSAITGDLISQLIVNGSSRLSLDEFRYERFNQTGDRNV